MAANAKTEKTKQDRVKSEINRLKRIMKKGGNDSQASKDAIVALDGLIVEAAELRIRLEDIREDLDENGYDELFSQSPDQVPYERERPQARRYISMNKNYQTIMKQLGEYIPKPEAKKNKEQGDSFDEFVNSRGV